MSDFIIKMSSLPYVSTAWRVALYNQLLVEVDRLGLARISGYVARAREHDRRTLKLDAQWDAQTGQYKFSAELKAFDKSADRVVHSVHDTARGHLDAFEEGDPQAERIAECLTDVFPGGSSGITTLGFVDQCAAMEVAVEALTGTYAALMAELAMTRMVQRLAEITVKYRGLIEDDRRIEFAEVSKHRDRGHLYLLETAGMIVGEFHDADNETHVRTRAELLDLFDKHVEADRAERMERRARRQRAAADENDGEPDAPSEPSEPDQSDAPVVPTA